MTEASMTESAAKVPTLEQALEQAAAWFHDYGNSHAVKGDWAKSKRNFDREAFCLDALGLHVSAQPAAPTTTIEQCAQAAEQASLPEGYQWGDSATECFELGKQRAAEAIRALSAQPAAQQPQSDLVERARSVETGREGHLPPKQLVKELADRIEALEANVDMLRQVWAGQKPNLLE